MPITLVTTETLPDGSTTTTTSEAIVLPTGLSVGAMLGLMDMEWDAQKTISSILNTPNLPPDARRIIVCGLESAQWKGKAATGG